MSLQLISAVLSHQLGAGRSGAAASLSMDKEVIKNGLGGVAMQQEAARGQLEFLVRK